MGSLLSVYRPVDTVRTQAGQVYNGGGHWASLLLLDKCCLLLLAGWQEPGGTGLACCVSWAASEQAGISPCASLFPQAFQELGGAFFFHLQGPSQCEQASVYSYLFKLHVYILYMCEGWGVLVEVRGRLVGPGDCPRVRRHGGTSPASV